MFYPEDSEGTGQDAACPRGGPTNRTFPSDDGALGKQVWREEYEAPRECRRTCQAKGKIA